MSDVNWHSLSNGNREKNTDLSSYAPLNPVAEAAHVYWLRRCGLAWRLYDILGVWSFQGHQLYYSHGSARKRDFSYADVTAPGIKYDFGTPESFTETNRVFDEQKRIQSPFLAWIAGVPNVSVHRHITVIITTYAVPKKKINNSTELTMLIWM